MKVVAKFHKAAQFLDRWEILASAEKPVGPCFQLSYGDTSNRTESYRQAAKRLRDLAAEVESVAEELERKAKQRESREKDGSVR